MSALSRYIQSLNTTETQWGIYVNPHNPLEEYRIGQFCFENGGVSDNWVCIGSLESLSYSLQSEGDQIDDILRYQSYKGRKTKFDADGIKEAYFENRLDPEFDQWLRDQVEEGCRLNAEYEANAKCEELEEYFAPDGDYWKESVCA